jgi:hypothetical protein
MSDDKKNDFTAEHIRDLALSFDQLPINARLDYVATLLCQRVGDLQQPSDPTLAVAHKIVLGVIELLEDVPLVGQWDGHDTPPELHSLRGPR